jgi:hypothetical protein
VDAPAAVAFSEVLLEVGTSYSPTEAVTVVGDTGAGVAADRL